MKCTSCGLPLSPARTMTSCPRCGTPIVSEKKSSSSVVQQPFPQTAASGKAPWKSVRPLPPLVRSSMAHPGEHDEAGPYGSEPFQTESAHVHSPVTFPPASSAYMPLPTPPLDPMWLPPPASEGHKGSHIQQVQIQEQGEANLGGLQTGKQLMDDPRLDRPPNAVASPHSELPYAVSQGWSWQSGGTQAEGIDRRSTETGQPVNDASTPTAAQSGSSAPQAGLPQGGRFAEVVGRRAPIDAPAELRPRPLRRGFAETAGIIQPMSREKNNLGFIAAGLCVIMGGLILVFIYFMAVGLPGNSPGSNAVNTNTATTISPTAAPSPVSSPTATPFPGQKYIDHAQLASKIDPLSHQATQLTTTFKAGQNIYVTFQLHPAGQNGTVCLLWYANNKAFFSYPLPVYASERTSYSFASYGGTGSGYVELYWASTVTCSDKVLAQRVNFTVTA